MEQTQQINSALIVVARESRGLTQAILAERMGISQSKLSKYETGTFPMAEEDLSQMCRILGYTREFFLQDEGAWGFSSFCFYHRKRASTPVTLLRQIQGRLNVFRMQARRLMQEISVDVDRALPHLDVDVFGTPSAVAKEIRRVWNLPMGPVRHLISAIERAGVIVWKTSFGTQKLDAVSQLVSGSPPIFFLNADAPADRLRFTLAHELGHVLMHASPSTSMEEQADEFAAEFLMPGEEIGSSLRNLSFDKLPSLKSHWRVSMAALIKRAADLDRISQRHYQTLFAELSRSGWRTREPIQIEPEHPTVLRDAIGVHLRDHQIGQEELKRTAFLVDTDEFVRTFVPATDQPFRVVG